MKKKILITLLAAAVAITGCIKENKGTEGISTIDLSETSVGVNGENTPVSRGYAAKMAAYMCGGRRDINLSDTYMDFTDVNVDDWYGKYINFCYKKGIIKGTEEKMFSPKKNLTLSEAQYFVNALDKSGEIKMHITEETKDKPISLSLWNTIYDKLLSATPTEEIKEEELCIFADNKMNAGIPENYVITNNGVYCCDGIDISAYENCCFKAYTKEKDIISVTRITDKKGYIANAYISNVENNVVTIFLGGAERQFQFSGELFTEENIGRLCDIHFEDDDISECSIHNNEISGILKSADNEKAETSSAGTLKYDTNMKIYLTAENGAEEVEQSRLTIGGEYRFILENGKIVGIIGEKDDLPDEIYLHIKNGSADYFGNVTIIKSGSAINITSADLNERTVIEPEGENLKIKTDNLEMEVKGRIEAVNSENGILLTNVVGIEDYTESLTVQKCTPDMNDTMLDIMAIISRTNAVNSMRKNSLRHLGASDEGAAINTDERIKTAAERTKGKIAVYNGEPISPFYFKCSCGNTADNGELWTSPANGAFPWSGFDYLKPIGEDLSDNTVFNSFIENVPEEICDPWQRWEYNVKISDMSNVINSKAANLCKEYENYVKVAEPDGIFRSGNINSVGAVNDITVIKRGKGGNAEEIEIRGEGGTIRVYTAAAITYALSFDGMNFLKADNTQEVLNTLPSVFFEINRTGDTFTVKGGGYGHGAGMGISDAKKLSESMNAEDIIKIFYKNVEIAEK